MKLFTRIFRKKWCKKSCEKARIYKKYGPCVILTTLFLTIRGKCLVVWRFRFGQYSLMVDHVINIEDESVINLSINSNHECLLLYKDKAAIVNLNNNM